MSTALNQGFRRIQRLAAPALLAILAGVMVEPATVDAKDNRFEIIATTYPMMLLTRTVTQGDPGVSVSLLVSPDLGCPHSYVVTPADMRRVAGADAIVMNGLGMDDFVKPMAAGRTDLIFIDSSAGIPGIIGTPAGHEEHPVSGHEGHAHEGHGHEGHGHDADEHAGHHEHEEGPNPHLFASPLMAGALAENIASRLATVRPSSAGLYRANAARFVADMRDLDARFKVATARLKDCRIVTQHDVFDYLARDSGLQIVAVIQNHPGTEPSASEMLKLVREVRKSGAAAVFTEPQYGSKVPATIAREVGIPLATLDPVASGPADAGPDYYRQTMLKNIETLEKTIGTR